MSEPFEDALYKKEWEKIKRFCALQERSKAEVRRKLYDKGIFSRSAEKMLQQLEDENFLNEERFAKAFCRGKFRINKWGRLKIRNWLIRMQIPATSIHSGLQEIDEKEYQSTIIQLIEKKKEQLKKEESGFIVTQKLMAYLMAKGFEGDLIQSLLNENE